MSWLRLDDGYDTHPKLLELTEQQRWRWTRVLIHCAKHRTDGHVRASVLRELGLQSSVGRLLDLGLIHRTGATLDFEVHDWNIYNGGSVGEKVATYLETHPDASANQVFKAIGGNRNLVLAEVANQRTGIQTGTNPGINGGIEIPASGTKSGIKSGIRARAPVPSPTNKSLPTSTEANYDNGKQAGPQPTDNDLERINRELAQAALEDQDQTNEAAHLAHLIGVAASKNMPT